MDIVQNYDYNIDTDQYDNWYKAKPYCFRIQTKNNKEYSFYLPISPQNLTISTPFATNMISTVYGVVEEHSEQRYYDIVITGTTGITPKNYKYEDEKGDKEKSGDSPNTSIWDKIKQASRNMILGTQTKSVSGRESFEVNKNLLGGFASRTQALLKNTVNQAMEIFGERGYESGVSYAKTGYIAFHNFYRFLLHHKKEIMAGNAPRTSTKHPIKFINYKDNNQYNVMIQSFQLVRSADNPMLYNYKIVMRGYKLETADASNFVYISKLAELGLDSVDSASLKSALYNKMRKAKNAVLSAVAAAKGFGG